MNIIYVILNESSKNYPSGTVEIRGKGRPYQWKRSARYLRCFWYKNSFRPYGLNILTVFSTLTGSISDYKGELAIWMQEKLRAHLGTGR